MDELDYWRLCDHLSVQEAAALSIGVEPSRVCSNGTSVYLEYSDVSNMNDMPSIISGDFQAVISGKFQAVFAAIKHAIQAGTLKAHVRVTARAYGSADLQADADADDASIGKPFRHDTTTADGELFPSHSPPPDWSLTTVAVEDLRAWLTSRGIVNGFFFPHRREDQPGYLDKAHLYYAPKLAAAIRAWEAVTSDPDRLRGKTPKQALTKWLNEHAAAFGLTKDDGTPNATGVEEAAKLANWKPEGGASKTPGG